MNKDISFFEYEAEMTRMERIQKRLILAVVIVSGLFLVSNIAWMRFLL